MKTTEGWQVFVGPERCQTPGENNIHSSISSSALEDVE